MTKTEAEKYLDDIWEQYDEGEISGSDIYDELAMLVMEKYNRNSMFVSLEALLELQEITNNPIIHKQDIQNLTKETA